MSSLLRNLQAAVLTAFRGLVALWSSPGQTQVVRYPWAGTDDEIVVNLAIGSLRDSMRMWLTAERGVHAETLLVAIGALAGFAAQSAVLNRFGKRDVPLPPGTDKTITTDALIKHLHDSGLLVLMKAKSGGAFYFGDLINGYLVPQATTVNYQLFGITSAAALDMGVKPAEFPDFRKMFRDAASAAGKPEYGSLHVVREHQPQIPPRQALDNFWPGAKFIFTRTDGHGVEAAKGMNVPVEFWPLVTALVARQHLIWAKEVLDPRIGLSLLMESAILMSKVDPETVPQQRPADVPPQPPLKRAQAN